MVLDKIIRLDSRSKIYLFIAPIITLLLVEITLAIFGVVMFAGIELECFKRNNLLTFLVGSILISLLLILIGCFWKNKKVLSKFLSGPLCAAKLLWAILGIVWTKHLSNCSNRVQLLYKICLTMVILQWLTISYGILLLGKKSFSSGGQKQETTEDSQQNQNTL